mgnify:CR=1 FL=1
MMPGGIEFSAISTLLLFILCVTHIWKSKNQLFENKRFLIFSGLFFLGIIYQTYLSYQSQFFIQSFKIVIVFSVSFLIGIGIALSHVEKKESFYNAIFKIVTISFTSILIVCLIDSFAPNFYKSILILIKDANYYQWKSIALYSHPNEFAYAVILQSFLVLIAIEKSTKKLVTFLPFLLSSTFFVYLSSSRNGWIGIGILSLIYVYLIFIENQFKFKTKYSLIASVFILLIVFGYNNKRVYSSVKTLFNNENKSISSVFQMLELERYLIWESALNQLNEHPITGKGFRYFLNSYEHIDLLNPDSLNFSLTGDNNTNISLNWNKIPFATDYKIKIGRANFSNYEYEYITDKVNLILDSLSFGQIYKVIISTYFGRNKPIDWSEPIFIITPSNHPDDVFNYIEPSISQIGDSVTLKIDASHKVFVVISQLDEYYNKFKKIKTFLKKGISEFTFKKTETVSIQINKRTFKLNSIGSEECLYIKPSTILYSKWQSLVNLKRDSEAIFRYKQCHQNTWDTLKMDTMLLSNSETYEFQSLLDDNTWSKSKYYSTPSKNPSSQLRTISPEFIVDNEINNEILIKVNSNYTQNIVLDFIDYSYKTVFHDTLYLSKGNNKFIYSIDSIRGLPLAVNFNETTFMLPETIHEKVMQNNFNAHNLLLDLLLSIGIIGLMWFLSLMFLIYRITRSNLLIISIIFLFGSLVFDNLSWSPTFAIIWTIIFTINIFSLFDKPKNTSES